eukprot:TRINITY_DN10271_c0_g1_i1.p1 TRINITY_DN10271_c0_g1~~TRINITY_DN10271_c0_g1_i1.p1  ORF type:complete len:193 (+),score=39.05 TRINITY_DN10271_c0_g1_i1:86-664(+)
MSQMKIVLLGQPTVGKTSLIRRYVHNEFEEITDRTERIGFYQKKISFGSQEVDMNIYDTAGMEKFDSLTPIYYRKSNVVIFVFDITKPATFNSIKTWVDKVREDVDNENVVMAIAANKIDRKEEALVDFQQVQNFAKQIGAEIYETSAKVNSNVDKIFVDSARRSVKIAEENTPRLAVGVNQGKKSSCCGTT